MINVLAEQLRTAPTMRLTGLTTGEHVLIPLELRDMLIDALENDHNLRIAQLENIVETLKADLKNAEQAALPWLTDSGREEARRLVERLTELVTP